VIVGTAGHIDHGKTALVRALTGVDTDRLPEEKRRGISIELGYAFLELAGGKRIGFIDVPGHERLVHTMLAGATGMDNALLLVAADDGVMPQTREHFAVLNLLGIDSATFVITKIDRVDSARLDEVREQIMSLAAGTPLGDAPVYPVSAPRGEGLDALKARLHQLAGTATRTQARDEGFRLAIDRVFTVDGTGTVVTGTVHAGSVARDDELALVPDPGHAPLARVRGLHAQNRPVGQAGRGERCALALTGVSRELIHRGQWLVSPGIALATQRADARIALWRDETVALRSGTRVQVHAGAAAACGTVAILDPGDLLAPGGSARVQLLLHTPLALWRGDRVVLRDASASRTLAGGEILDPTAPARYRRTAQRLAELDALAIADPAVRLRARIRHAVHGLDLGLAARAEGRLAPVGIGAGNAAGESEGAETPSRVQASGVTPRSHGTTDAGASLPAAPIVVSEGASRLAIDGTRFDALQARALEALARFHQLHPEQLGPESGHLRRLSAPRLPEPLWQALLRVLQQDQRILRRGGFVHLPEHAQRLSAVDERIAQAIAPLIAASGYEGAWVRDLARDARESEPLIRVTLARLSQRGELHQIVRDLVYDTPTATRLAAIARALASASGGSVTAAGFRDATGLGRKRAIQILEYFDRVGLLRRVGDLHRLRTDCRLFMD
jgi:selenocysteine-specific elongation factor